MFSFVAIPEISIPEYALPQYGLPIDICSCPGGAILVGAGFLAVPLTDGLDHFSASQPYLATLVGSGSYCANIVAACHC